MKKILFSLSCALNLFSFENQEAVINYLKNQIDYSVKCAEKNITKLPQEILEIHGMSTKKNRILLNTLGEISKNLPVNYLEIGVWKGSTFIASNYGNSFISSFAIDNWSEFQGPKSEFFANTNKFLKNGFSFLDSDSFSDITFSKLNGKKFDIYFYDGHHSEENQYKAFKLYDPFLADIFIAIVDDWSWPQVKSGTQRAFKELGYEILKKFEIDTIQDNPNGYWNGLIVALIKKPSAR